MAFLALTGSVPASFVIDQPTLAPTTIAYNSDANTTLFAMIANFGRISVPTSIV